MKIGKFMEKRKDIVGNEVEDDMELLKDRIELFKKDGEVEEIEG